MANLVNAKDILDETNRAIERGSQTAADFKKAFLTAINSALDEGATAYTANGTQVPQKDGKNHWGYSPFNRDLALVVERATLSEAIANAELILGKTDAADLSDAQRAAIDYADGLYMQSYKMPEIKLEGTKLAPMGSNEGAKGYGFAPQPYDPEFAIPPSSPIATAGMQGKLFGNEPEKPTQSWRPGEKPPGSEGFGGYKPPTPK